MLVLASIQRASVHRSVKHFGDISFDAVCVLVMQIPAGWAALEAWIFRDTDASGAFSAVREGW